MIEENNRIQSISREDLMKHSFVISIDDVRLEQFKNVFNNNGLSPIPETFPGVTDEQNTP